MIKIMIFKLYNHIMYKVYVSCTVLPAFLNSEVCLINLIFQEFVKLYALPYD